MKNAPVASFALVASLLCASACSPYREVRSVTRLGGRMRRVVIVEVVIEGASVSDRVQGLYTGSNLVVDDEIPMRDGHPQFNAYSGHEVDSGGFGKHGGVVPFGAPVGTLYVLGIRAESTSVVWSTTSFLPMVVQIPPAVAVCEYLGTIHLRDAGQFELRDEFDQSATRLAAVVTGCQLTRNLGRPVGPGR